MTKPLPLLFLFVLLITATGRLLAQNTIVTQTLPIASICPGSTIDVPFTVSGTYPTGNTFTVQLSNGGDYANIPTGGPSYSSATGRYTVTATIPVSTAAGTTYRLRVTASSPAVIGSPSNTQFSVKVKPSVPTVSPLQVLCQGTTAMQQAQNIYITVQTVAGATAKLYNDNGSVVNNPFTNTVGNTTSFGWLLREFGYSSVYKYPVNETTYQATQVVDGCESEKVPTAVRVLYTALNGPTPANRFEALYGRLEYCQGSQALPLDVNGHEPAPAYYRVVYKGPEQGAIYTSVPPTPPTGSAGQTTYALKYETVDASKACAPYGNSGVGETYLQVKVKPRPTKPNLSTDRASFCLNQATSNFENNASVWYTIDPTNGNGLVKATRFSTDKVGTFKYYVASLVDNCESEKVEFTVEVKAAASSPTATNVNYCVGQQANPLTAVAAGGGSLVWYANASSNVGAQAAPTPPTSNAGTLTYYVAQTVGSSCESQRVPLTVTISGLPAAPFVTNAINVFCQNSTGTALSATGQNLKWYDVSAGGTGNSSLVPNTATAGQKTYYVSQTVNGCEGPRASTTVTILDAPAAPTVVQTNYEFCQGASAVISGTINPNLSTNWYIYGTSPGFVDRYQSGNTAYAVPPSDLVRTMTYSIYQTSASGCRGEASPLINVTIKAKPTAPATQAVVVCQGVVAPTLQASGQSLLWYEASSGGTGTLTTPTVSTTQTMQKTYYVSQTQNGCESTRSALSVIVNAIPSAPVVGAGLTYCQNTSASALTATGQNLRWYSEATGGSGQVGISPKTDTPGSFMYYVSQSIANCKSPRSSLAVKVNVTPGIPATTGALNICQKTTTEPLKAEGTSLRWFDGTGRSISTPTPSSEVPGQVSYFVTQTVDNCESTKAEIKVTVKATPVAPGTSPIVLCQNEMPPALTAAGQGLKWYTAGSGGDGLTTAPTISATQASQTTYYVSQSADGCEGPRAALLVTVKRLPGAPGVTPVSLCQFAKTSSLSAVGTGLIWYDADGKMLGSTGPTPATDKGVTLSYMVTQTEDGCVSPKATLTVTVLTTPSPTLPRAVLELCKGVSAAPLEATGTNLKWTDPTGTTSTTAPVPFTTEPSKSPEGDVYYVTQTGINGCESVRATIRIFVQGPPTLALSGGTTVNLGMEAAIALKFTGVGPYQFKIATGVGQPMSGTALKDTIIQVLPARTTIYQVAEVSNRCGVGLPTTTATVVVLVPTIQTNLSTSTTVCAGTILTVPFQTTGDFNSGSEFRLQVARQEIDSTKIQYADLVTSQRLAGQISAVLPTTATAGTYLIRVIATNPKIPILGTPSTSLLTVRPRPGAVIMATSNTIYAGDVLKLSVAFSGEGPWKFAYRDSSSVASVIHELVTNANPHVIEVKPAQTTTYRLVALSNECGSSLSLPAPMLVVVSPLLAVEPLTRSVEVFPVPATTVLTVQLAPVLLKEPVTLLLTNEQGRTIHHIITRQSTNQLELRNQPAGVYVLSVQTGSQTFSRRIVKQ